jgi:hypothetical protein
MFNPMIKVRDLPEEIKKAYVALAVNPHFDDEVCMIEAMQAWSAWEFDDKRIGRRATELVLDLIANY